MENFFKFIMGGVLILVVIVLIFFLVIYGCQYLMAYIPCEIIVYTETTMLLLLAFVIAIILTLRNKNNG